MNAFLRYRYLLIEGYELPSQSLKARSGDRRQPVLALSLDD